MTQHVSTNLIRAKTLQHQPSIGSGRITALSSRDKPGYTDDTAITQTLLACAELSRKRIGALIVFERDNRLGDQLSTGTLIDAATTAELLKNIFYPKAPLHDGAVIIRNGRIASAGCMLPLSSNGNLSRELGMRHRAGIGMSEHSDAVVAIVSEETGSISVAVEGMLKRHLSIETAEKLLRNELQPDINASSGRGLSSIIQRVKDNGKNHLDN
jgi:diadenylate cyclase